MVYLIIGILVVVMLALYGFFGGSSGCFGGILNIFYWLWRVFWIGIAILVVVGIVGFIVIEVLGFR